MPQEQRWIDPAAIGAGAIGHLGFFRARFADTLWPPLARWLLAGEAMALGSPPPGKPMQD